MRRWVPGGLKKLFQGDAMKLTTVSLFVLGALVSLNSAKGQEVLEPIALWPATPPGRVAAKGEEKDTTNEKGNKVAGKSVIRLGNVSSPTLTIYKPPADKNTGTAVLICPGGGYNILAYDLEGYRSLRVVELDRCYRGVAQVPSAKVRGRSATN